MKDYQRILVAVDLSDESQQLLTKARRLADKDGAALSLVHVVEYVPLEMSEDFIAIDSALVNEELVSHAREAARGMAERFGIDPGDCYIELGSTKAEIIRAVQASGADLLVIGNHTRHGLALLLGATGSNLLGNVPCDVLAIRMGG